MLKLGNGMKSPKWEEFIKQALICYIIIQKGNEYPILYLLHKRRDKANTVSIYIFRTGSRYIQINLQVKCAFPRLVAGWLIFWEVYYHAAHDNLYQSP